MGVMAMFPLGSVLLPSAVLPLHIFEDRYRQLARDCLAGDGEFGVVLIERGHEVGGGDVRCDIGTVAHIVEAVEFDDGRWAVVAVGTRRVRVREWLDDAPYPRAEVDDWPDEDADVDPGELDETVALLRRVLALHAELGQAAAPATTELSDQPALAIYQLVALAPVGPADKQALLSVPGCRSRLQAARRLLEEEQDYLLRRLALDSGDEPLA